MIYTVSEVKAWSKGSVKIGDTLFVDGMPYTTCGVCDMPIKQVDAFNNTKHTIAGRDKKETVIEEYKVTVGYWLKEQEIVMLDNGMLEMHEKNIPIMHTRVACYSCWDKQNKLKANAAYRVINPKTGKYEDKTRLIFYHVKDVVDKPRPKQVEYPQSKAPRYSVDHTPKPIPTTHENLINEMVRDWIPLLNTIPVDATHKYPQVVNAFTSIGHMGNIILKRMGIHYSQDK